MSEDGQSTDVITPPGPDPIANNGGEFAAESAGDEEVPALTAVDAAALLRTYGSDDDDIAPVDATSDRDVGDNVADDGDHSNEDGGDGGGGDDATALDAVALLAAYGSDDDDDAAPAATGDRAGPGTVTEEGDGSGPAEEPEPQTKPVVNLASGFAPKTDLDPNVGGVLASHGADPLALSIRHSTFELEQRASIPPPDPAAEHRMVPPVNHAGGDHHHEAAVAATEIAVITSNNDAKSVKPLEQLGLAPDAAPDITPNTAPEANAPEDAADEAATTRGHRSRKHSAAEPAPEPTPEPTRGPAIDVAANAVSDAAPVDATSDRNVDDNDVCENDGANGGGVNDHGSNDGGGDDATVLDAATLLAAYGSDDDDDAAPAAAEDPAGPGPATEEGAGSGPGAAEPEHKPADVPAPASVAESDPAGDPNDVPTPPLTTVEPDVEPMLDTELDQSKKEHAADANTNTYDEAVAATQPDFKGIRGPIQARAQVQREHDAAVVIQAQYRGYRTRAVRGWDRRRRAGGNAAEFDKVKQAADFIESGYSGYKVKKTGIGALHNLEIDGQGYLGSFKHIGAKSDMLGYGGAGAEDFRSFIQMPGVDDDGSGPAVDTRQVRFDDGDGDGNDDGDDVGSDPYDRAIPGFTPVQQMFDVEPEAVVDKDYMLGLQYPPTNSDHDPFNRRADRKEKARRATMGGWRDGEDVDDLDNFDPVFEGHWREVKNSPSHAVLISTDGHSTLSPNGEAATYANGTRKYAYDGSLLPPGRFKPAVPKETGWSQWRDDDAADATGVGKRKDKLPPMEKEALARLKQHRKVAVAPPVAVKNARQPVNSYRAIHQKRSNLEKSQMSVNLATLFREAPGFHPDTFESVDRDARKVAKQLGIKYEEGPSTEEDFIRYKFVHDRVWSDQPDPEGLAAAQPTMSHELTRSRRKKKGDMRLPAEVARVGSKQNEINLRSVLPEIGYGTPASPGNGGMGTIDRTVTKPDDGRAMTMQKIEAALETEFLRSKQEQLRELKQVRRGKDPTRTGKRISGSIPGRRNKIDIKAYAKDVLRGARKQKVDWGLASKSGDRGWRAEF